MPRAYPHSHLCHGVLVGFSVKLFGNCPTYYACFNSKDGRRLKRDTNQTKVNRAIEAARAMIEEEYTPSTLTQETITWEEAIGKLEGRLAVSGNRNSTLGYYKKVIRSVQKMHSSSLGPADISPGMAETWRDTMMKTPNRRKKLPSAHYITSMLVGLSSLWQKWFVDDLKIVPGNPWQDVKPPKADKIPVRYATDELIEAFYKWTQERYGEWAFPALFLSAKAYTGCRLMDLCSLSSAQLQTVRGNGRLVFPADLTKGRKERSVPLPEDLQAALDAFKGETWLWENYLPGLKAAIAAKGWPTHQLNREFSPQRLYSWVETLFADYRTSQPAGSPTLTTHMFRKRAFTMAWQKGVDARRASIAYGCNVDTLMRHYVQLDEQQVTDEVFSKVNEK
jgi:integrase